MQELEKILEEIENLKEMYKESEFALLEKGDLLCVYDESDIESEKVKAISEAIEIIQKHMNEDKCAVCSRRKWYLKGYEDGKNNNDGWIQVEQRLPERTLDEKINKAYKKYLVFIDSVDGWNIDIAVYNLWNDNKWRETHDGCDEIENVIAWRPLPEPYRPERSDNHDRK